LLKTDSALERPQNKLCHSFEEISQKHESGSSAHTSLLGAYAK
jgi:hypothetical protein